jgi:hypothetical protein
MFRFSKFALAGLALGTVLAAGCAKNGTPAESSLVTTDKGVMCSKCQTTWVKVPMESGKGSVIGYTSRQSHLCPDCKGTVDNFFATGKLERTCKACGDSMEICETQGHH